jgi:hypothetical protein
MDTPAHRHRVRGARPGISQVVPARQPGDPWPHDIPDPEDLPEPPFAVEADAAPSPFDAPGMEEIVPEPGE